MNDEKIILFSILILALFVSVACVSLSDASEGEEEPVASIGEVKYTNLQVAIDDASDGDVVTLESDIFLTEGGGDYAFLVTGKSITIDLNGYRIEQGMSSSHYVSIIATKVADTPTHLVLKDSSEKGTGCIYTCGIAYSMDAAVLIWNDISKSASDDGKECSITFEGGTYHAEAVSNEDGMVYTCCGTVIEGENIKKGVWVKGGNFILDNVGEFDNGSPWILNARGNNEGRDIMVTGGTFNDDIQNQSNVFEVCIPKEYALKKINNNTYTIVDAICYVNVMHKTNIYYQYTYGCESFEEAVALIDVNHFGKEGGNGKGNTITMINECCINDLGLEKIEKELYLTSEKGLYALDNTNVPENIKFGTPEEIDLHICHKSSSVYPCLPGECTECHESITPAVGHSIDMGKDCIDQSCSVCNALVKGTGKHNVTITCIEQNCIKCGSHVSATTEHVYKDGEESITCIDRDCTLCGGKGVIEGDGIHAFESSVRDMPCIDRKCTICHNIIDGSVPHVDSDPTKPCITRSCAVCGGEGVIPITAEHKALDGEKDITCIDRDCSVCGSIGVVVHTTGHAPSASQIGMVCIDRTCDICKEFTITATEEHTFEERLEDVTCIDRTCIVCHTLMKATSKHTYADGEESITCIDRDCAVCGTKGVFSSTTGHSHSESEATMTCIDRDCSICGGKGLIKGDGIHEFDASVANKPCIDRTCILCNGEIEPIAHIDSDPSKTCVNRPCSVCGTEGVFIGDGNHEFDASVENMPCISRTCTLCHGNIAPSENHKDSEPSKTCIDRPCSICGTEDVFEHSSDHTPSENETDMPVSPGYATSVESS